MSGEPAAEAGGPAAVLTLHQYPEQLVVAGLAPGTEVPSWAESSSVFAVVATALETTIVCAGRNVPNKVRKQGPFTGFAVAGHVDPALTGVLAGLLEPLAEEGISVLTLSTYSTDWILVPRDRADDAGAAWRRRGHDVVPAPVITSGKS